MNSRNSYSGGAVRRASSSPSAANASAGAGLANVIQTTPICPSAYNEPMNRYKNPAFALSGFDPSDLNEIETNLNLILSDLAAGNETLASILDALNRQTSAIRSAFSVTDTVSGRRRLRPASETIYSTGAFRTAGRGTIEVMLQNLSPDTEIASVKIYNLNDRPKSVFKFWSFTADRSIAIPGNGSGLILFDHTFDKDISLEIEVRGINISPSAKLTNSDGVVLQEFASGEFAVI